MKTRVLFCLMLASLVLAGCRRGQVQDLQRNADGSISATVQLTEADVNTAISDALAANGNPLLRDPQVDLQNGQIVVNGTHEQRDGTGTVSGSFTLTLTVESGTIKAQIISANIDGVSLSDARIADLNQRLTDNFNRRANRENRRWTVNSLTVSDNAVDVSFTYQP
jgi:outer membrane murein-binding lipoprotein Lpp